MGLAEITAQLRRCQQRKAEGVLDAETAGSLAQSAVTAIMAAWQKKAAPPRDAVTLLCELATADSPPVQRVGVQALFAQVVEPFNDSFSHSACALYDQLFAQVISFCRQLPGAAELHETLNRFGLYSEDDLLVRKARLLRQPPHRPSGPVSKVVLLSRVTIGADVAINGVLLAALRARFPQAEFVWLGSRKLHELFGGNARTRVRELRYERSGDLLTRLTAWLAVLAAMAEEGRLCWQEDPQSEMLVIDADSRLTQLGLLPVVAGDRNYFYFESRSYGQLGGTPLAQLTAQWASEFLGTTPDAVPALALLPVYPRLGKTVRKRFCNDRDWLVCVSWGTGGNARKRLDETFETALILNLLNGARLPAAEAGAPESVLPPCKLILDKGGDENERAQINRLLAVLRAQGKKIIELDEQNAREILAQPRFIADVVTWDGGIGALAGLIAASDVYLGYDSAGQHLAAALGTGTVTLFVNSNAPLFAARWRPFGPGKLATVNVKAEDWEKGNVSAETLLEQTVASLLRFADHKK